MNEKQKILFVDDEPRFTEDIAKFLRLNHFDVQTAYTAEAALKLVKKEKFDLMITDINMPGMDGIELIRRVKELEPDLRIMVVTGFPSDESQKESFELGILNYLIKPFSSQRFLELVSKSLSNNNEEGLFGPMELSCEDLIQTYAMQRKSLVLEINTAKGTGRIYFQDGRVIHAETPANKAKEAFYEIQSWKSGTFKTEALGDDVSHTINQSVEVLLLEGAKLLDENGRAESKKKSLSGDAGKKAVNEKGENEFKQSKRRHSMPSLIEECNLALKELADNTPGLNLGLLVDNEGLIVTRYSAIQIPEGAAEKSAVASLALLGLAKRTTDQLDLKGFQEVLVKADTGYVYSLAVGGPAGYALVARTDQNVTLGALFMTVRAARERINRAMGVA